MSRKLLKCVNVIIFLSAYSIQAAINVGITGRADKWVIFSSSNLASGQTENNSPPVFGKAGQYVISGQQEDMSRVIQSHLDAGKRQLFFPAGTYVINKLLVPANTVLKFAPGAVVKATGKESTIQLKGDNITIDGATFDLSSLSTSDIVISAEKIHNLKFLNLATATWQGLRQKRLDIKRNKPGLIKVDYCIDVEVSGGRFADINYAIYSSYSARLVVRDNKAERCYAIICFRHGSEYLNYYGNWSCNVIYPCVWWGGDSNDRKKGVTNNSARICQRGIFPEDEAFDRNTAGTYDISIQNNFAEYGKTLAWGSKGRNILMNGNIARYMSDLAYDTEGGENVVISNNISINSKCAGIGCYFYGERILITGNQLMVLDEGDKVYQGNFIRLHSPGKNNHFGNGQVTITGNQMISELKDRTRYISIESARNIMITGNTFKNGSIKVSGLADRVTIFENNFESSLPGFSSILMAYGGKRHVIKGNSLIFDGTSGDVPAISLSGGEKVKVIVDGNLIENWRVAISGAGSKGCPMGVVIGNRTDGKITFTEIWKSILKDNIKL